MEPSELPAAVERQPSAAVEPEPSELPAAVERQPSAAVEPGPSELPAAVERQPSAAVEPEPSELLAAEREITREREIALSRDLEAIVEAARLVSTDDEHDPEGSTIAFERSQTATLLEDARKRLTELDEALARVKTGEYGVCRVCGQPIAAERLAARPTATTCINCAT
ncbi:TraR/DksA C4-type zinc finger protein [Kribbella sp. NPDC051770]|uniref:TraR/DksA family transcriptional regulator n=1 Tax=Kribbella sp. NPDC051770 TaxID=3155413 RepID=UPI00341AB1D1